MISKSVLAIQVRLGSSRLPCKSLLPYPVPNTTPTVYTPLVQYLVTQYSRDFDVALLCPSLDKHIFQAFFSNFSNLRIFGGPEENLLERYALFSRNFQNEYEYIVRLCSDSPALTANMLLKYLGGLNNYLESSAQDFCFVTTRQLTDNLWKGFNIDVFRSKFLASLVDEHDILSSYSDDQFILSLMREYNYIHFDWTSLADPSLIALISTAQVNTIDTVSDYRSLF